MPTFSPALSEIGILIIDDHPVVRDSLENLINAQNDMGVVGSVGTREEAYKVFEVRQPDVVVMDVALSDAHGLELIQDLRAQFDDVRFVVFSMYDEQTYAERAVQCGAHGYVMKSQPASQLISAIRIAHGNDYSLSKSVMARILRQIGPSGSVETAASPISSLTTRELEVYQLIGQGEDATRIAERLSLSRKTVETYRRRIKEKLELDSLTSLIHHAMRWTDDQSRIR